MNPTITNLEHRIRTLAAQRRRVCVLADPAPILPPS